MTSLPVTEKSVKRRLWKPFGKDHRFNGSPSKVSYAILKSVMDRCTEMMKNKLTFSDVMEEEVRKVVSCS